jgi:hypothetical protein
MNSIDRVIDWPCGLHLGMRITPVSYFRRRDHRGSRLTQRDSRFMPMNTASREDAPRIADTITGIQPVERTQRRSSREAKHSQHPDYERREPATDVPGCPGTQAVGRSGFWRIHFHGSIHTGGDQ